jgi:hypothetical protein
MTVEVAADSDSNCAFQMLPNLATPVVLLVVALPHLLLDEFSGYLPSPEFFLLLLFFPSISKLICRLGSLFSSLLSSLLKPVVVPQKH